MKVNLTNLREVAPEIAIAAGLEAQRVGVAPKATEEDLRERVMGSQWAPAHPRIGRASGVIERTLAPALQR
jgi:hypothetical protein